MADGKTVGRNELAITLSDVVKRREKGGVAFELRIPAMRVRRGQFVALVGPSGCGKSTLLDMLGLVLSPTSAAEFRVWAERDTAPGWRDIAALGERGLARLRKANIGYVLQTGGLLPFLSVRDNITLTRKLNGMPPNRQGIEKLAQRLGIAEQLGKKPAHLSGGQRQRAAIARALAHQPFIILADEPTAAVDRQTALEIRDQFREMAQKMGATVLMVTHDQELVRPIAERVFTFELERPSADLTVSRLVEADNGH